MKKHHDILVQKIERLLNTGSLMGAIVLLKSLTPATASQVLETLPQTEQKKLYDAWLGSGEKLLKELPVQEIAEDTPPEKKGLDSVPFFPDHFISQATAMLWIICLISILTIFSPAGLETKANPFSTPIGVKPEWYLLFLYALLRFVPPILGVLVLLAGGILLTLLPFLDKNREVKPSRRKFAIVVCVLLSISIMALSFVGASVK